MQLYKQQPSICLRNGKLQQVRITSVSDRCKKQRGTTVQYQITILVLQHPGQSSTMHRNIPLCCTALTYCCCLRALTTTEQLLRQQSQSLFCLWQTKK